MMIKSPVTGLNAKLADVAGEVPAPFSIHLPLLYAALPAMPGLPISILLNCDTGSVAGKTMGDSGTAVEVSEDFKYRNEYPPSPTAVRICSVHGVAIPLRSE